MEEMKISKATDDDIEGINDLRLQVQVLHASSRPDIFKAEPEKSFYEEMKCLMNQKDTEVLCGKCEGKIICYAVIVFRKFEGNDKTQPQYTCRIEEICVDQESRKMGYGRLLMDFIRKEALAKGVKAIRLNVWSFNESAMEFYREIGFVPLNSTLEHSL